MRRLLIVEDDQTLQRAYRRAFSDWDVVVVDMVVDAVQSIKTGVPDAIISDMNLRGPLTGADLWDHCQDACPGVPFVIVSGDTRGLGPRPIRHLSKPASMDDVRRAIEPREPDPIAKWYDDRRREADRLHALIERRKADGASDAELRGLRQQLEQARYVGD